MVFLSAFVLSAAEKGAKDVGRRKVPGGGVWKKRGCGCADEECADDE